MQGLSRLRWDSVDRIYRPCPSFQRIASYVADATDCDDSDTTVNPDAEETWYDGVDADCDGWSDHDADFDGYDSSDESAEGLDCDDEDPAINPDAEETWYDGVDSDCDGWSDYDADGDGFDSATYGGDDCDDADDATYPGAPDDPYDGVINDCDEADEYDADGDGHDSVEHGGDDCDDANSDINPSADEVWYDGIDPDCDGNDDDQDYDGFPVETDCDDAEASVNPDAEETWYDGVDQDCDGNDDDQDLDGYPLDDDCDDTDPGGLVDSVDSCPEQPEDFDGWQDKDGCPDPSALVTIKVVDESGALVPGASSSVTGPQTLEGGAEHGGQLHPGAYQLRATADGWLADAASFEVQETEDQAGTLVLRQAPGLVQLRVTGPDGQPMDASFTVGDSEPVTTEGGEGELQVVPGAMGMVVRAEGYAVVKQKLVIDPGETELVEVQLRPTQVELTVEKIEIKGEVYFDTAKATIKPESFPLLDEVAQVMFDHPEVLRLRIEGHTDSRGDNAYNLNLSKERAASVLGYLTDKGVAADRLESEGYGESKPLDKRESAAAWEKNRRVDFFVAQWDEAKRTQVVE